MELEIEGLTDEISAYIPDMDEFEIEIKTYLYKHGLIDATIANISEWSNEEIEGVQLLQLVVNLNDSKSTVLNVTVNLTENTYEITK